MRTPAFFLAFLVLLACRANDDRALPDAAFQRAIASIRRDSSPPQSWNTFEGPETGYWSYTSPHKLLPETVPGYVLLSTPVDLPRRDNRGYTKSNWGRPVVYGWWNGQAVVVWCQTHHKRWPHGGSISLSVSSYSPVIAEPAAFHGLKASFAKPWEDPIPLALGHSPFPFTSPIPFRRRLYFSFRLDNLAFDLCTEARTQRDAEAALLGVAEAIYLHNRLRHSPLLRP